MYEILKNGGFTTGGLNFDCKLRRQSCAPADLFHGHIGGMDHMALALRKAAKIIENDFLAQAKEARYKGWQSDLGKAIDSGKHSLESLAEHCVSNNLAPKAVSGQQELLENKLNRALFG